MKLSFIFIYLLKLINSQYNSCDNCINRKTIGENVDCVNICQGQTTHLTDCLQYTRCLYDYDLHKVHNICICEKVDCNYEYICPYIEIIHYGNENIHGYTVYKVSLELKNINSNIYAIYGTPDNPMIIPAAFQLPNYQGTNVGGINPIIEQYIPDTKYDSWLTIEITDGDLNEQVDAIGIDFSSWNETNNLIVNDGAIFLDDPLQQISRTKKYIIAQLTLKDSEEHQMIINVNGKTDIHNPDSPNFREIGLIIDFPKKEIVST